MIHVTSPLNDAKTLRAGEEVAISGVIYTARDAAHQRLVKLIAEGKPLPFDPQGAIIYYVGPTPPKPGHPIGSAGPTTSVRMDSLTIPLLQQGVKGMIGKGGRGAAVIEGMKEHGAVYFAAIGGAAAFIAQSIKEVEVVAYPDLGAEAVHRMVVENFPAIVAIDSLGNNIYEQGVAKYRNFRSEVAE
ncbi:MAG: Fe-S-containing hydro-lyase [Limnochordia bacterium]|nr:Fe-S-containing hydro-lyase [Limnochordia bacterium]